MKESHGLPAAPQIATELSESDAMTE
jgi:hypothetical protein